MKIVMTKKDLIVKLKESLKVYSFKDVAYATDLIFDSMAEALKRGERIEIRGFGNFTIRERKERLGRNPKSGVAVKLKQRKTPFFKTGKALKLIIDKK